MPLCFIRLKGMISRANYIQVSDDVSSEKTMQRELEPLLSIRDAYPKMILSNTKHPMSLIDGVKHIDIARWLMGDEL